MNITNHAKERYIERLKGINNRNEIKQYLAQNEEIIENHILKLYEYSEKVFTGQIGGDKTTKDFYLNGDICLVVGDDCIRTIYKINFAFPEHTRLMVIRDLKEEIVRLQDKIETEGVEIANKREGLDSNIAKCRREIERLQIEMFIAEDEIKVYEAQKEVLSKKLRHSNTYLQNYAEQLLGNTEYKKDIVK